MRTPCSGAHPRLQTVPPAIDRRRFRTVIEGRPGTVGVDVVHPFGWKAGLVERLGQRVAIFPGSYTNVKITYQEDILLAEALLQGTL